MMILPENVKLIIKTLKDNEFEAFVVGGCVRDSILGLTPKDWDITTSAMPADVKKSFTHTFDTGIQHGTVTVLMNKVGYEVTTYRIDGGYTDNRRPDSVFFTSKLTDDLVRRDFTINAIAYDESTGFVDPFGGIDDIGKRLIKGVGDPDKRFKEDALRMLRAVRFSAQLGFVIDSSTYEALVQNVGLIKAVSVERVRDEVIKLLLTQRPEKLQMLIDTGLWNNIHPESHEYLMANIPTVMPFVNNCSRDISLRLCLLLMNMSGKEAKGFLKYFRFDNKTTDGVLLLIKWVNSELINDYYHVRRYLKEIGEAPLAQVMTLKTIISQTRDKKENHENTDICNKILKVIDKGHCYTLAELRINGQDLKELGITNGKDIGAVLNILLDRVLQDPELNKEQTLKSMAAKENQNIK